MVTGETCYRLCCLFARQQSTGLRGGLFKRKKDLIEAKLPCLALNQQGCGNEECCTLLSLTLTTRVSLKPT